MRGKAPNKIGYCFKMRITPAYAGKSKVLNAIICILKDHPRLCGEKLLSAVTSATTRGSPPPMRGKAQALQYASSYIGITPAYAGKRHSKQME